jgi:hypothetical protein
MWATSAIFRKLTKVNNHLLGENSPNLVTLPSYKIMAKICNLPWWRGAVDIASASGTRRPGFQSRQGIRF